MSQSARLIRIEALIPTAGEDVCEIDFRVRSPAFLLKPSNEGTDNALLITAYTGTVERG
jgi:hypothetical protein